VPDKVFQVVTLAVMTPPVKLLLRVVWKMLPEVSTHLGLFACTYWGFAGTGIALYCGKITQSMWEGGPHDWCTGAVGAEPYPPWEGIVTAADVLEHPYLVANCSLSTATGVPWNETPTGGSTGLFALQLNFDGYLKAFSLLYVVMIANNWNTAGNGAVEVSDIASRWFFFVFLVVIGFIMMNILVGAIVDGLSANRDEMLMAAGGPSLPLMSLSPESIPPAFLACVAVRWQRSRRGHLRSPHQLHRSSKRTLLR